VKIILLYLLPRFPFEMYLASSITSEPPCEMEGDGGGGEPKNTATISTLQGPDDEYVLSSEKQDVATRIQIACEDHDIRSLTDIAASPHGFIDDVYRCVACAAFSLMTVNIADFCSRACLAWMLWSASPIRSCLAIFTIAPRRRPSQA